MDSMPRIHWITNWIKIEQVKSERYLIRAVRGTQACDGLVTHDQSPLRSNTRVMIRENWCLISRANSNQQFALLGPISSVREIICRGDRSPSLSLSQWLSSAEGTDPSLTLSQWLSILLTNICWLGMKELFIGELITYFHRSEIDGA